MKRLYLGRFKDAGQYYEIGKRKKDWHPHSGFNFGIYYWFCADPFEKITSITLAPGEIRKIKSIKIELE